MKPYIEYEGKTYEFTANFKLQKEYNKEVTDLQKKKTSVLTSGKIDIKQINECQNELLELKKQQEDGLIDEEEAKYKTLELASKYHDFFDLVNDEEGEEELYEKYAKRAFLLANPNDEEIFDKYIDAVVEDNGYLYVQALFKSIVETLFTSAVDQVPLPKPSFAWESKSKAN